MLWVRFSFLDLFHFVCFLNCTYIHAGLKIEVGIRTLCLVV